MATTTNYGWTTPDDTALVKDGAAAIRTLGSSVDTTTKALNPSTTLGDIEYRSSTANTNTRLGIGSSGQVLAVSAGVPAWTTVASGGMTLISTTTLTGASVTLSSIPQTYVDLKLVWRNYKATVSGSQPIMSVNADTTANRHYRARNSSLPITDAAFNDTIWTAMTGMNNTTTQNFAVTDLFDYTNTTTWKTGISKSWVNNATNSGNVNIESVYLVYNQVGAISSLLISPSSGTLTSGTLLLYGVK